MTLLRPNGHCNLKSKLESCNVHDFSTSPFDWLSQVASSMDTCHRDISHDVLSEVPHAAQARRLSGRPQPGCL